MKMILSRTSAWRYVDSISNKIPITNELNHVVQGMIKADAPPSSLCDPKRVQRVGFAKMVRNLVPLPASSTKRGRRVVLEAPRLD
jgi:hypothetical protein